MTKQSEVYPTLKATINMSYRETILRRVTAAVCWSLALQAVLLVTVLFVLNFSPWHPILWIERTAALSVSLGTWLYFCPVGLAICIQCIISCKDFMVVRRYCGTRFALYCNMFTLHNLIMGTLFAVTGGLITWMHLSLLEGKFGKMFAICTADENKMCLVEEYLFLILNGFWIGMYVFVNDYVFGHKTLYFPVVQQFKFLQVKAELQSLMKRAMIDSLTPNVYFVVLYYWNGGAVRGYVTDILEINIEEKSQDTMFGLMNIYELFYSWLFSSTFIFTIYSIKLMLCVNLTEQIVFPITSVVENSYCLTLHQSLAMTDVPIIQYLGFLDLKVLAEKDRSRREELFTLSQPGGHPYNWNAVVEETLKLIRKFTEDINKANTEVKPTLANAEYVITKDYSPLKSSAFASNENQGAFVSGMRNMSLRTPNMSDIYLCQSPSNITHFQSRPVNISQEPILRILQLYSTQALDALCRKPGISFIFGDLPDAKVRYHLAQCQPVIWAIQGLSCLAAASFKEDRYGVVQKDLPAIITSLLQLKQALDRLQKVGNYKRSQKYEHHNMKMKAALRSAVKRSLYTVCIAFGDYVKDLPLTKEVQQQIQHFLNFREG